MFKIFDEFAPILLLSFLMGPRKKIIADSVKGGKFSLVAIVTKMVRVCRKKAKFSRKVKYLVKEILATDFRIKRSEIRCRLSTDRVDLKFRNGYSIYGTVEIIKEELRFQIALSIFDAYEKAKRVVDIVDEPQSCVDFQNFKVLLYSSANFEKKLERYFKKVVHTEVYDAGVKTRLPLYLSFPA